MSEVPLYRTPVNHERTFVGVSMSRSWSLDLFLGAICPFLTKKCPGFLKNLKKSTFGGVLTFHQQSICITQLTLGPCVMQIWSRYGRNFEPTKPSYSTEW